MDTILMPVGNDLYAIAVAAVREVAAAPSVTPLPTAPSSVLGLFNLRGEIVPLLDSAVLLGVGRVSTVAFALVLRTSYGLIGLAATAIPRPVSLGAPVGRSELSGTAGICQHGRDAVVLLDLDALLSPDRLSGVAA
jgi:purine-binding chemotaxis protein CheW